jgi:type I restriction enzyme, S subunit
VNDAAEISIGVAETRHQLPAGWRLVRLGDVCEEAIPAQDPLTQPTKTFRYVDITSVDNKTKRIVVARQLLGRDAPSRARQVIRTGDVILATTRPNLNAVALVPPDLDGQICSTGFCVLRAKDGLDPGFLFAFVQTKDFVEALSRSVRGAMYPAVTDRQVQTQLMHLPSLQEQRRIVAILNEQMAIVERARLAAETQLGTANALPAAYLRALFDSPEAKTWPVTLLGEASEIVSGLALGRRFTNGATRSVPYVTVSNVKDGYLDLSEIRMMDATQGEIRKCLLEVGDIILTEGGDPDKLGRGTMWEAQLPECVHQNHIFRVRFAPDGALPEFVAAQIGSAYGKRYFFSHAKRTTGIATINRRVLSRFPLMVPPRERQHRAIIDSRSAAASAEVIIASLQQQLAAINAFPGALLRRAFHGGL